MATVTVSNQIAAPVERVFQLFTDVDHGPAHVSGIKKIEMLTPGQMIPPAEVLSLQSLITPTEQGIASRILAKTSGGHLTLFAFDTGQGLTEHTSPFDALVMVLEGSLKLTISGTTVRATPGTVVRMPADIPHALAAPEACRMLLIMLRDLKAS
jgi:quercetin dioxygenase-like cupin family protein